MSSIRLNQFLSKAGVSSRRKADDFILSGKIQVNGKIFSTLGTKIDPEKDRVTFNGKELTLPKEFHYILLHKPIDYVSTRRKFPGEKSVYELLPKKWHHLWLVGRLDKNSEGLLVFTNDGDFTLKMSHPKFLHEKVYEVLVSASLAQKDFLAIRNGVGLSDGKTHPAKIKHLQDNWYELILHEGKKRQIRRMMESLGFRVIHLRRTHFGPFSLGDLPVGEWKETQYIKP